jgi:hypothetical protein
MSDTFPSAGQVDNLEHTDENHAKKVNSYVWNSGSGVWERMTQPGSSTTTNYITKIDDTTTTDMVYIGKAALTGSAISTASAVWQIKRIDTSTLAMDKKWADGNDSFDNIWDSRSSLTYN